MHRPTHSAEARTAAAAGSEGLELARLRQYVPGHIADSLADGKGLSAGERHVTVMFVDVHGYTAFAQDLAPEEVFQFISLFIGAVSAVVRDHGGFVVEFNGDGMMAVFGAPVDLPRKERAALDAARATLDAVRAVELPAPRRGAEVPPVSIGLATGPAFVGTIRAVDRSIWSAVGTTTNLASRLQVLSRDLDACIVMDAATRDAAGPDPDLIRIPGVLIRGLRRPLDLFALPR